MKLQKIYHSSKYYEFFPEKMQKGGNQGILSFFFGLGTPVVY